MYCRAYRSVAVPARPVLLAEKYLQPLLDIDTKPAIAITSKRRDIKQALYL